MFYHCITKHSECLAIAAIYKVPYGLLKRLLLASFFYLKQTKSII